jgi:uncharacterized protein YecT (DUF1311 family)
VKLILLLVILALAESTGSVARPEQTQADMNQAAARELKAAEADMNMLLGDLAGRAAGKSEALTKLTRAQQAWKAYRDAQVEAKWPSPDRRIYGSVLSMCVAIELANLTRARAAELRKMATPVEGEACDSRWPD